MSVVSPGNFQKDSLHFFRTRLAFLIIFLKFLGFDGGVVWTSLFLHVSRIQPHRWHNSCWVSDKSTAEPFAFAMAMATFSLTISCKQRDHFQWRFIFETPLHHLSNHFKSGDTAKKIAVLEVLTLVVVRKPKSTSLKNWRRSQCWFYAFFSQV